MARWVWPTAAGVVTSLIGIAINLATEWKANPLAWVAVVVLTGLGVGVAMRVQAAPASSGPVPDRGGVHNSVSGTVHGPVIQAGSIGSYHDRTVNQTAIAHENSTIHQAGRDIRSDGAP